MKLHELRIPEGSRKKRKRVGRGPGSGLGKTSGRGHKGQKARSGGSAAPWSEGGQMPLHRRLPKRGFKNRFRTLVAVVNLKKLARLDDVEEITPEVLLGAGLIRPPFDCVKILGEGEISRAVTVRAHRFSKSAVSKIMAAGGKAEVIER